MKPHYTIYIIILKSRKKGTVKVSSNSTHPENGAYNHVFSAQMYCKQPEELFTKIL